jgi:Protein kinase domain/TPM domain
MSQREGLEKGEVFAGYSIVRRLGSGGMGEVYLAQHPRLPRRDALKILPLELTANLEFRQRFNREAELAASLYHEHIVGIHDRGEYDGQLWISMDYVEGTDAAQLLHDQYPSGMPTALVTEIISAVADALDYAHERGLLHRDVKPANILLGSPEVAGSPHRRILLADFGIARELGEVSGLTATNMLVGTTAYCSPEQLQGFDLDARADQYALGCTAYNLLTGSAPFHHSNPAVVISQHLSAAPPHLGDRRPDLANFDPAIARALAKTPEARYATCADFATALAAPPQAAGPTQVIPAPHGLTAAPGPTPRGRWRGPAMAVAALAAVALLGVAAIVGIRTLDDRSDQAGGNPPAPTPSPPAGAGVKPPPAPLKLTNQVTDRARVLTAAEHHIIERAVDRLRNDRGTKLWVVYVKSFGGAKPLRWAEDTMRANAFTDTDALLAIATEGHAFSFRVPVAVTSGKPIDVEALRRDRIEPAVARREWTRAAVGAADGLNAAPS